MRAASTRRPGMSSEDTSETILPEKLRHALLIPRMVLTEVVKNTGRGRKRGCKKVDPEDDCGGGVVSIRPKRAL